MAAKHDIGHNTIEDTAIHENGSTGDGTAGAKAPGSRDEKRMTSPSALSVRRALGPCFPPALVFWLGLFGCGAKIPPTHYYVLELPAPPSAQVEAFPASAVVMPFRASAMLMQDRIVYRPAAGQVGFYEYHRWAEDPRQTVTSTFIDRLRALRTFETVVPFDGRTKADYLLRGRIEKLEEVDYGGGVTVNVRLTAELVSFDERKPIWQGAAEQQGRVEVGEVSAVVTEMSRAAQAGLDKLSADLDRWIRANATPLPREEGRSR